MECLFWKHNLPTGPSRNRTHPSTFHSCQWCQTPGIGPKLPAGVCSSFCVHQCRNIAGVVPCGQHLVKQIEGSHQAPQGLAQNPIAHHWGAWFSPFPPSKLVQSSVSKPHCSCARTPFPTWERLIPSGVSRSAVDKSSCGQNPLNFSIDTTWEPHVNPMELPVPINIIPCYWKDQGNHSLCSWSLHQLSQGLEVSFDLPLFVVLLLPVWTTNSRQYSEGLSRLEFSSNVP